MIIERARSELLKRRQRQVDAKEKEQERMWKELSANQWTDWFRSPVSPTHVQGEGFSHVDSVSLPLPSPSDRPFDTMVCIFLSLSHTHTHTHTSYYKRHSSLTCHVSFEYQTPLLLWKYVQKTQMPCVNGFVSLLDQGLFLPPFSLSLTLTHTHTHTHHTELYYWCQRQMYFLVY